MKNKRLGEMLVDVGVLSEAQLQEALTKQVGSGKRLGTVLIDEHYITETQLIDTLRMQLGIDYIDLNKATIDPAMAAIVPKALAQQYRIVPVKMVDDRLYLAMEDPLNFIAVKQVKDLTRKKVTPMIAYSSAINRAISVLYENEGAMAAIEDMKEERALTIGERAEENNSQGENQDAPTIRLVNSIFQRAIDEHASDIHIEPQDDAVRVRMRVDGRMTDMFSFEHGFLGQVVSRLKVMADMNITEHRIPQDGRALVHQPDGTDVDARVSTLPTIHGENVVIRLLWRDAAQLTRRGIGITENDNKRFDRILKNSSGMIIVVGPTGSGKTSTLYTMIQELNRPEVNMISLEDPVEFQIPGVTQVAINEKVGLTFASALRSCLRQDPDIICVGEIRDGETAEIAMRAAMTGHLVLSTIHTEDAVSAVDRLRDLGIEPYLIAGSLRGIISQRLVRKICNKCREEIQPDPYLIDLIGMKADSGQKYYHGRGCTDCLDSGYHGRTGVFEILTMTSGLRDAIASGKNGTELREALEDSKDFVPMIVNARDLVRDGITTVEEVIRTVATIE